MRQRRTIGCTRVPRRPVAWGATMSRVLGCSVLLGCAGGADDARSPDSSEAAVAVAPDSLAASVPRASDATLVIEATTDLLESLRPVTDSFAVREAIRVMLAPRVDRTGAGTTPPLLSDVDLVVIPRGLVVPMARDSTAWMLPFAELLPLASPAALIDSVARADSARIVRTPTAARGTTRRSADSIRMDSAHRTARRLRTDSVRTLVLTIPRNAPNSSVAERFVRYLLTDGRGTLSRSGVHVLTRLVLRGHGAPPGVRALVDTVVSRDYGNSTRLLFPR